MHLRPADACVVFVNNAKAKASATLSFCCSWQCPALTLLAPEFKMLNGGANRDE